MASNRPRLTRQQFLRTVVVALVLSVLLSALFLFVGGAFVRAGAVVFVLVLFPAALILTHQVLVGAAGLTAYFVLQAVWWCLWAVGFRLLLAMFDRPSNSVVEADARNGSARGSP